jgi:hypothetical protein
MDWEAEAADPNPAAGEDEEMDEANGNEEEEEEEDMNVDDMPVTQEDAWAVIRCVRINNEPSVHLEK